MIGSDSGKLGPECIRVQNLDSDLLAALGGYGQAAHPLKSILRVRVVGEGMSGCEDLPDVFGRNHVLEGEIRFIPHFPFEPGVGYCACFDPRPLGLPEFSEVLTLEFSLPRETGAVPAQVNRVFPSSDVLPENLLRFYVCFSNSMQRDQVEKHVKILGPDGQPAPDVLYRAPVELWDRTMRHLTILLDPGRLKRGVGPYRQLGPPLKPGLEYTLAINSEMVDQSGNPLRESFYKTFLVTEPVHERIAVEQWNVRPPVARGCQPLVLEFPRPLDWAQLLNSITVVAENGNPMEGRVVVEQSEKCWSLTPTSTWVAGSYLIRVASSLEDVCGNNLLSPFDRPLRISTELREKRANHSIPFNLE